jgi:hypothetical protein
LRRDWYQYFTFLHIVVEVEYRTLNKRIISSLALVIFLCGCTWGDLYGSTELSVTPTPSTFSSSTPSLPVITPTPADPSEGNTVYSGPLSKDVQAKLYQASLDYIAPPGQPAKDVVHRLGYLNGIDEDPSNACGPISEKFLELSGLLPEGMYLHKFWILDAHTGFDGRAFLEKLFPENYYYWYQTKTRTSEFDFAKYPLYPGDWLYLFGGDMGFDHMLTVTHRDGQGRVYTVTNSNTDTGVAISEYMLYDPAQPHAGILYTWNDAAGRGNLGTTGRGGFILIRKKDGTSASTWDGLTSQVGLSVRTK